MSRAMSATSRLDRSTSDVKQYMASTSLKGSHSLLHISVPQPQPNNQELENAEKELLLASEKGNWAAVELLSNTGVDVNCRDWSGYTPLHWSATVGHADVAALLICKGAHIDSQTLGNKTPLYCAAHCYNGPTIALLLEAGADSVKATQGLHDDEKALLATYVYSTTREALSHREQANDLLSRTFQESTPGSKCASSLLDSMTASLNGPSGKLRVGSAPLKRHNSEPKILLSASPKAVTPRSNCGTILESSQEFSSVQAGYSSEPPAASKDFEGLQPGPIYGHQSLRESQALIPNSRYKNEAQTKLGASVVGLKGRSHNNEGSLLSSSISGQGLDSVLRARHRSANSIQLTKPLAPLPAPIVPSLPPLRTVDHVEKAPLSSHATLVRQQQPEQQEVKQRIQQHIHQQQQQQQTSQQPFSKEILGPSGADTLHSWLASINQPASSRPHSNDTPPPSPRPPLPTNRPLQSSHPRLAEQSLYPSYAAPPLSHQEREHQHTTAGHVEPDRRTPPRQRSSQHRSSSNSEQESLELPQDSERCSPPQHLARSHRPLTHKQELAACIESQRRSASPPRAHRHSHPSHALGGTHESVDLHPERHTPPRGNNFQEQIDLLQAQLDLDTHVHDSQICIEPQASNGRKTPTSRRSQNHALDLSTSSLSPQDVTHPPTLITRPRAHRTSRPLSPSRPSTTPESRRHQLLDLDGRFLSESSDSYPPLYPSEPIPLSALPMTRMTPARSGHGH